MRRKYREGVAVFTMDEAGLMARPPSVGSSSPTSPSEQVLQNVVLREFVLFGRPDPSSEPVWEALSAHRESTPRTTSGRPRAMIGH